MLLNENKINKIYLLFILFLPFSWASIAVGSLYRLITILLFAIFIIHQRFRIILPTKKRHLFDTWSIYVVYSCVSVIWGGFTSQQITIAFGMVLLFLISLIFMGTVVDETENDKLNLMWIIATAFFVMLFLTGRRVGLGWTSRQSLVILGTETDANEFASFFSVGLSIITISIFKAKKMIFKVLLSLLFLGGIYVVLMSGSRGALLALVTSVLFTLFVSKKLSAKGVITLCFTGVALYFIISHFIIQMIPENTLARLSIEALTADNGSGRSYIWKNAINDFWNGSIFRILFGYGYGGLSEPTGYGVITSTMHNQFLQNLIAYGVIGFTLYLRLIYGVLKELWRINREYVSSFIGVLVMGLTITMGPSYKLLWIMMMISMLGKTSEKKDEKYGE